jgi:hypothetical protein
LVNAFRVVEKLIDWAQTLLQFSGNVKKKVVVCSLTAKQAAFMPGTGLIAGRNVRAGE